MLVLLVATAKILAAKATTSIDPACLPCFGLVASVNVYCLTLFENDILQTNIP
jgi:hypothetical protein